MNKYKPWVKNSRAKLFLSNQKKIFFGNDGEFDTLQAQNILFNNSFENQLQELQKRFSDKIVISSMIHFLLRFNKLFFSSNEYIITQIIDSGAFEIILNQIDDMGSKIFSLFKEIVHCQTNDLMLLLQNNFCHALLYSIFNDDDTCMYSFDCLIEILSRNNFFYVLIYSTNIIRIIYDFLSEINSTNIEDNKNKICYCFIFLSCFFSEGPIPDENIPIDSSSFEEQYKVFISSCQNPDLYDQDLFNEFLKNGINITSPSTLYYQVIELSLSIAGNSCYSFLINNFLFIMYYIIFRNVSSINFFLKRFHFYDYFHKWIDEGTVNYDTFYFIVKIYSLFYEHYFYRSLYDDFKEQSINEVLYIFDNFLLEDDELQNEEFGNEELQNDEMQNEESGNEELQNENLETEIIYTLYRMVDVLECDSKCVEELTIKKRKETIVDRFFDGSFRSSKAYAYLILSICEKYKRPIEFLTYDILERIFLLMDKKKGNFVNFVLDEFEIIFRNQQNNRKRKFFDEFQNCSGVDFLMQFSDSIESELMNEDDQDKEYVEIIHKIKVILDKYFSNKDNDNNDDEEEEEEDCNEYEYE